MLIGIDASRTTAARRTGTGIYSLNLIRALLDLGTAHTFRLYFNEAPSPGILDPGGPPATPPGDREHSAPHEMAASIKTPGNGRPHVEYRVMPFPRLWTHARLSWEMATQPPDLLFVPAHVLPLVHPRRSVVTVHDLGYLYYPQAHTLFQNLYLRWSTRRNARAAVRLLADSEATRQDLVRHYHTHPDKVEVVYPGRDESLAPIADPQSLRRARARYGLSATDPYLLYVGTLHPRKNLVRLVQAFAATLARLDEPLYLVLAGQKGWLYDDIFAEVRRLGLDGRVLFPGFVPAGDLPSLLSGALAFVFPSLYEGFGLPVLEAMACGSPVVCSNTSSLPEVAGDAALLVDPLDVDALASALLRIVADESLRLELIDRGFRQVRRFSWTGAARQTMHILKEAGRGSDGRD